MTNDPPYPEQLAFRAKFNFDGATRQTPIPGNVDPSHRFVRADYYRQMLPEPKNEREAIAGMLAIARNVSVPFGAPNNVPGSLYNTEYRSATDLTNRRYYFELTTTPNVIWVDLISLIWRPAAPFASRSQRHQSFRRRHEKLQARQDRVLKRVGEGAPNAKRHGDFQSTARSALIGSIKN